MPKMQTIEKRGFQDGILQNVDDELAQATRGVRYSQNLLWHKITGRGVVREGTALVGAQITDAQPILGLHQFILSSGTKHLLAVIDGASNSALYRLITTTWTSESISGVKNVKHRFLTFQDAVLVVDGTNKTSSVDGDAWITTGGAYDLANMPAGKYVIEWRDRVYVAGVSAALDTLYYSGLSSGTAISWTVGNGTLKIEPYDGQGTITGLAKVPGYLLIFKERALKRWNGASTYPDDLNRLGTPSQESVVLGQKTCFYFSSGYGDEDSIGFYETNGSDTVKISRNIQEICNNISSSNYSSIAGYATGEIVMWSIGNIVLDGITYSNVVILYHIPTRTWAMLTFPTFFKVFALYIDSNDLKIIGGNSDGEIMEIFTTNVDDITGSLNREIEYSAQYHPMTLGRRDKIKEVSKLVPHGKNLMTAKIMARTDEEGGFKEIGAVETQFENEADVNLRFHILEIRIAGVSQNANTEIIGIDIISPNITQSNKL